MGADNVSHRRFDEGARLAIGLEQRLDLATQPRIGAARLLEKARALRALASKGRLIEHLDLSPAFWGRHSGFLSSRNSHAFASRQSRLTVSPDTSSTSAVSSMVKPPKNRNSTT